MPTRLDHHALLAYWRESAPPHLLAPLERRLAHSPRFVEFGERYRDKIRKKMRSTRDEEGLRDVLCELETAGCLLREPRFEVEYEAYAHTGGRTPDLSVTWRTHTTFHVEVARLRGPAAGGDERLLDLIAGKLGQMLAGSMNVLVVWASANGAEPPPLEGALKQLQTRAEHNDAHLFRRHRFENRAGFFKYWLRMSAVLLRTDGDGRAALWHNKQARQPLAAPIARALCECFTPAPAPPA